MPFIKDLSYILPNGDILLKNLTENFRDIAIGLVGRNGAGKTILAKLIAGLLKPSSGIVKENERTFYLDQLISPSAESTVAHLAGFYDILHALRRIEEGIPCENDLEIVENHWDIKERFTRELNIAGLPEIAPELPAQNLSGGEYTRIALIGAFLSGADYLILDEPTNHLDTFSKKALIHYLGTWKKGLLVISHDRILLERMEHIMELSHRGLKNYGGNYSFYAECKEKERLAAQADLEHAKTERRRAQLEEATKLERQEHRQAQGRKKSKTQGGPAILLGAQKRNAEKTSGKIKASKGERLLQLANSEREAYFNIEPENAVVLIPKECAVPASKIVCEIENLVLPWGKRTDPLSFTITGPERVALLGSNGSGKTTLLRLLTGEIKPASGNVQIKVPFAYLDQYSSLDSNLSSTSLLTSTKQVFSSGEIGTRLAQIGIADDRRHLPIGVLSGGERLKLALLRALLQIPSPQFLILDEPTNHLDLESVLAVESLIERYTGAILVVSHDQRFLENINVKRYITLK